MRMRILIRLKEAILDPQGKSIEKTLQNMGYEGVQNVRQGKIIELDISETDPKKAEEKAYDMAKKLLANEVMEEFEIISIE